MPHLSRYSDLSDGGHDVDHAHISLMNVGADICIPGGNDTNKMHLNILFYELDKMLKEMREENRHLREEVEKIKGGGGIGRGDSQDGNVKEVVIKLEDKLKQMENKLIGKINLESEQTKKNIDEINESLNKINSKITIMDLRVKKDSKDNRNDVESMNKVIIDAAAKLNVLEANFNEEMKKQPMKSECNKEIVELPLQHNNEEVIEKRIVDLVDKLEKKVTDKFDEEKENANKTMQMVNKLMEETTSKINDEMTQLNNLHQRTPQDIDGNNNFETERKFEKMLEKMENKVMNQMDEDREETKCAVQALFVNTDIDNVKYNIEQLSSQIRDIKGPSKSSQCSGSDSSSLSVMFDAIRNKEYKGENDNDFLTFDQTSINLGDGFDVSLGKFTAPVSGIYLLTLNVYGAPRDAVIMSIRVKSGSLGNIQGVGKGSQSVLVALKEKDTARVYVEEKTKLMDTDQEHFTHFIGVLLRPLQ